MNPMILPYDASRYARETLAIALYSQKYVNRSTGAGAASTPMWQQLSPQQREGWRFEADQFVAETVGVTDAVTKHQTRRLERWEAEMEALSEGNDPDGYFDNKDHRADKTIADHYRRDVDYNSKLSDDCLFKAWEKADSMGRALPPFPTGYFDPVMVEKVSRRPLTPWEAAVMAVKVGSSIEHWEEYRFGVPYEFRFAEDDVKAYIQHVVGKDAVTPVMSAADQVRYKIAFS